MKDKVLEIFKTVELHDSALSNLNFAFEQQTLEIIFELYDDLNESYEPIHFKFGKVTKFISEYPEDMEFNPEGCHNAVCKKKAENKYEVEFAFELWQGQVVWGVIIDFETLKVTGGLSEEALKYKYEELAV